MHENLKVFCTKVGEILTNCYVIYDIETNDGIMIDPGDISNRIDMMIAPLNIKYILLTHGHFDHIGGVAYYSKMKPCKVMMMDSETEFINNRELNLGEVEGFDVDRGLNDGDILDFNKYKIKVIATPGHTSGSCCYTLDNFMFSGDTLMEGAVGRIDFPTGSFRNLKSSLGKLKNMDKDYFLYPGHGASSKLSFEINSNPYMQKV